MMLDTEEPNEQNEAFANEVRVVQAVQMHASAPILVVGNCLGLINVPLISFETAVSSGAFFLIGAQLIMLIPMVRSYFRIRNKNRPGQVSKRRIRLLELNSLAQGLIWSTIMVLMMSKADTTTATLLLWVSYIMVYGGIVLVPTMPRAASRSTHQMSN